MKSLIGPLVGCVLLTAGLGAGQQHSHHRQGESQERVEPEHDGRAGSATGYIRDAACLFRNPEAKEPDDAKSLDCAQMCVRGGSPLVLYTSDGGMYFVLSGVIPDRGQHERFLPYVGKLVRVSGRVFDRAGAHAIAIQEITVVTTSKN